MGLRLVLMTEEREHKVTEVTARGVSCDKFISAWVLTRHECSE